MKINEVEGRASLGWGGRESARAKWCQASFNEIKSFKVRHAIREWFSNILVHWIITRSNRKIRVIRAGTINYLSIRWHLLPFPRLVLSPSPSVQSTMTESRSSSLVYEDINKRVPILSFCINESVAVYVGYYYRVRDGRVCFSRMCRRDRNPAGEKVNSAINAVIVSELIGSSTMHPGASFYTRHALVNAFSSPGKPNANATSQSPSRSRPNYF